MSCSCSCSLRSVPYKNKGQEKIESFSSADVSRIVQKSKTVIKDLGKYNHNWGSVTPRRDSKEEKWTIQLTSASPRKNSVNQGPKNQFLTVPGQVPESDLPEVNDRFRVWPGDQTGKDSLVGTILSADKDGILFHLDERIGDLTEMFFKISDWETIGRERIDPA